MIANSSKTIRNLINDKTHTESKAERYELLCLDCTKKYMGETFSSINKQIYEHTRD